MYQQKGEISTPGKIELVEITCACCGHDPDQYVEHIRGLDTGGRRPSLIPVLPMEVFCHLAPQTVQGQKARHCG